MNEQQLRRAILGILRRLQTRQTQTSSSHQLLRTNLPGWLAELLSALVMVPRTSHKDLVVLATVHVDCS
jgi:hypothetical protein